jgi:hypothetical protein
LWNEIIAIFVALKFNLVNNLTLINMKKTLVLFSTVLLFASFSFAQTPQTQDKTKPAPKTETAAPAKDSKAGCDEKTKKECSSKAKSCCASDAKKGTETKAPEKK